MLNLVRVGKEWAGPVFPHPKTLVDVYSCQYGEKVGRYSFSPALALNLTDVEKIEVGKKLIGYFSLPGKKWLVSFFPGEEMGRPDPFPGKDWRGEKTDRYTGKC